MTLTTRPVHASTSPGSGGEGERRRRAAPRRSTPRRQAERHARPADRAPATEFTVEVDYAGTRARPARAGASRLGGAHRRGDRRQPAERGAVLVPVQRPTRATRRRYRIAVTTDRPTRGRGERRARRSPTAASTTTWVYVQHATDGDLSRDRADRSLRDGRVAADRCAQRAALPHRLDAGFATRLRPPDREMMACFDRAVRAVPVRRLHRGRRRRHPRDPARGPGHVDLRREPHRRDPRASA